jgi:lysophospholipid acyltransferase (LPLAT)-like uncharacterized protein
MLAKNISRTSGLLLARYLMWVWSSSEVVYVRGVLRNELPSRPAIIATWHGQHFLAPFVRDTGDKTVVLIAHGVFGSMYSNTFRRLGLEVVRGAAGRDFRSTGGYRALRNLLRELAANKSVALTAEVPGIARVAGRGIIALARHAGVPIIPLAVVGTNRLILPWRWDKPTITLPFGRVAVAFAKPISVSAGGDRAYEEDKRRELAAELNRLNAEAADCADAR